MSDVYKKYGKIKFKKYPLNPRLKVSDDQNCDAQVNNHCRADMRKAEKCKKMNFTNFNFKW
jgi:hypothetical protein